MKNLLASKNVTQGRLYLIEPEAGKGSPSSLEFALDLFSELLADSKTNPCIAITCELPRIDETGRAVHYDIGKAYNFKNFLTYWLSETKSEQPQNISPANLEKILNTIKTNSAKTILIEGLECMKIGNGFDALMDFIARLAEYAAANKATVLLPVNPEAFPKIEYELLKTRCRQVKPNIALNG